MDEKITVVLQNTEEARAKEALAKILDFLTAAPVVGAAVYDPPDVIEWGDDDADEIHFQIALEGKRTLEGRMVGVDRWYVIHLDAPGEFESVYVPGNVWDSLRALAEEICERLEGAYYDTLGDEWERLRIEIKEAGGE